jgi:hypothetical protein
MGDEQLERQLRRLVDKDAIRDLVAKYSVFIDLGRREELLALFTEDCLVDYGPSLGGPHQGAAFVDFMTGRDAGAATRPRFRATTHHNANVLVEFVDDDTATGWAGLYAWHEMADGTHAEVWGYYEDEYVRTPDGWRFRKRVERTAGHVNFPLEWNRLRT